MKYKNLGKTDIKISQIGFGCMSLGTDERATESLLHKALDLGINYFDTADLYDKGLNETYLGKALSAHRSKVVIATKVGNQRRPDGSGWDWNPHKDYIIASVEKSLQRLQTDYIDLYQLHGGTLQDPIDETISAFEQLLKEGKIRSYGISSIRPNVIREWMTRSYLQSVMMQYSLLDRRLEETIANQLQENGISLLTRGSVAQGLLVNKPAKPYLNYSAAEVTTAAQAIKNLSSPERTPAQTALRFVLQQPAVTSAVVGIRTAVQLEEAVVTLATKPLSAAEYEQLQKAVSANHYTEHR